MRAIEKSFRKLILQLTVSNILKNSFELSERRTNDVFEQSTSTKSGLFAILGSDFDQIFGQIVSVIKSKDT